MSIIHAKLVNETAHDRRSASRRGLKLLAYTDFSDVGALARIYNISQTGMLLECDGDIAVGEAINVSLPHGGDATARIVWRDHGVAGCEFEKPISLATVSACLLRAEPEGPRREAYQEHFARIADRISEPHPVSDVITFLSLTALGLASLALLWGLYSI